jgi:hypothetical protein
MTLKKNMTKLDRLSKGQRTYQRLMKQVARQEGTVYRSLIMRRALVTKTGETPKVVSGTPVGE